MKAAVVSILGRPSVGKSTLLNKICGYKVSITAESPQTTRNRIKGIYTEKRGQIVFVDTPGFHLSEKKINRYFTEAAVSSLDEIDGVLYLLDIGRPPGKEEGDLLNLLKEIKKPVIPVINKIDVAGIGDRPDYQILSILPEKWPGPIRLSARTGEGIEKLLDYLFSVMPEGELMYPEEYYTDQDPSFRAAEIIREKAVRRVRQEIPHAVYVEIADMEQTDDKLWIRAFLVVERDTQKAILIGRNAETIKKIREGAQRELRAIFPGHVKLDLRVKVNKKWRNNDYLLRGMYRE